MLLVTAEQKRLNPALKATMSVFTAHHHIWSGLDNIISLFTIKTSYRAQQQKQRLSYSYSWWPLCCTVMQLSTKKPPPPKYQYNQIKFVAICAANQKEALPFLQTQLSLPLLAWLLVPYVRAIKFNDKSKMLVGELGFDYHAMVTFNCSHLTPDEMPRCRSLSEHLAAPRRQNNTVTFLCLFQI